MASVIDGLGIQSLEGEELPRAKIFLDAEIILWHHATF
jgi:hypothetical protein